MFLFEWNKEVLGSTWGASRKNSFVCSFVVDAWHLCFHLNGIKYLTCGVLHNNLFVRIHVWHPCFHLNGIKKYLARLDAQEFVTHAWHPCFHLNGTKKYLTIT